jgi:hypothetical protein
MVNPSAGLDGYGIFKVDLSNHPHPRPFSLLGKREKLDDPGSLSPGGLLYRPPRSLAAHLV